MGSSWHENVVTYGLVSTGATVCSPLLAFPDIVLTNELGSEADDCVLWFIPTFVSFPYVFTRPGKVAGHPNFPYGLPVVPNVPM